MQIDKTNASIIANDEGFLVDFADIYSESKVFQSLVDSVWVDKYQNSYWKDYFYKSGIPLVTNSSGASLYSIDETEIQGTTNAMSRAKYSDMPSEGFSGPKARTGSIGDFGKSHTLLGKDKQVYDKLDKDLQGNFQLFKAYIGYVGGMLDSHNMTINLMAAQKISTTRFTNAGYLADGYDIPITTPYEVTESSKRDIACGDKTWDDADATIIDDIRNLVEDYRDETYYTGPISLKMPKDFFYNIFLKNTQVRDLIMTYSQANGAILSSGYLATKESYEAWNEANGNYLPPIELMVEETLIQGVSTSTAVKGWKDGIIVLSPSGYQGQLMWATSDEYDLLNGISTFATAKMEGGLLSMMNRVNTNGRMPEWITEVIGCYEPVLDEWNKHWCINYKKANA